MSTGSNISSELREEISTILQHNKDKKQQNGECMNSTLQVEKPTEAHKSDHENENENQSEPDSE